MSRAPLDAGALNVCVVAYTHYRSDPRVRREAEALRTHGFHVTVLALQEAGRPAVDDVDGVEVRGLSLARHRGDAVAPYLSSYGKFFVWAFLRLSLRPRAYDLVHVHCLPEALVFAAAMPRLGGTPVLLDVRDLSTDVFASRRGRVPRSVALVERISLRFANEVLTVHEEYRNRIVARGVSIDRVSVALNVPEDGLFPTMAPTLPTVPLRIIYHGTLTNRYGVAEAVRAVGILRDRYPGSRLALIGDGDARDALTRQVADLDLADVVTLSDGRLPLDAIADEVASADVGLALMTDDDFTQAILPTKLLEYVKMGRPVVVSRNPVIERYFSSEDVFYVRSSDVDDVAAALESIAADPAGARARAARAQRFFDTHNWSAVSSDFVAMAERMIRGSRRRARSPVRSTR